MRSDERGPGSLALWLCADVASAPLEVLCERIARVVHRVPACVWLRPRTVDPAGPLLAAVRELAPRVRDGGGALIIGDRVDVALAGDADGVHLGARSIAPVDARRLLRERGARAASFVSVAAHSPGDVDALAAHAEALVLSPLFAVPGKGPALGLGSFAAITARAPARTFVALGGIVTAEHAADAARAGADAFAVRRALLESADPGEHCAHLRDAFLRARRALDPRAPQ